MIVADEPGKSNCFCWKVYGFDSGLTVTDSPKRMTGGLPNRDAEAQGKGSKPSKVRVEIPTDREKFTVRSFIVRDAERLFNPYRLLCLIKLHRRVIF
jgi:hypothetical protein